MHLAAPASGLCRWWQAVLELLLGVQSLINQRFELRPGHRSLDDVALVFPVTAAGPNDEGWRGADVVQLGFRKIGCDQSVSCFPLHAGL